MLVNTGQLGENLARAAELVKEAAEQGSDIIVLPESMDLGWTYPDVNELADTIPGKINDYLCNVAKNNNMYIVVGLTERDGEKIYNSSVIISNRGEIALTHRKINELPFALDLYTIGNKLNITETEYGRLGLAICADLRPEGDPIGNAIGMMGARILLSPCARAVEPDYDHEQNPYGQGWLDAYTATAKSTKCQLSV